LSDSFPGKAGESEGRYSETYLCPQGFTGVYRLFVKRVYGKVTTGHVMVDVLTDLGRDEQNYNHKSIPLHEKNALVMFDVKAGRRDEPIELAQLEHIQDLRNKINDRVLAQFAGSSESSGGTNFEFMRDMRRFALAGNRGFNRGGAVGFQPVIQPFPDGATLQALAIISADRRYVRITPSPFFSTIGEVFTFNFVSGQGGTGMGGGGGGFGGFGGGGGGAGGGGVL
ncbi:MAG: hypothetical protein AAFP69_16810, partial [Planctomycetota bacterium]